MTVMWRLSNQLFYWCLMGTQEADLFNGGKQYRCINPERLNFLPVYEYGKCFVSKMPKLSNDDVTL